MVYCQNKLDIDIQNKVSQDKTRYAINGDGVANTAL